MRMLSALPFTLISFLIYNGIAFSIAAGNPGFWTSPVFGFQMVSGASFQLLAGDLLIAVALFFLFIEVLKATRVGTATLFDHMLSVLVLVAFIVEFLVLPQAATSVFFVLTMIALFDVVAGFSISITGARRDVAFGHPSDMN